MVGLVRLALRRPYTFIAIAALLLVFGAALALRTATVAYPNTHIPAISGSSAATAACRRHGRPHLRVL